MTALLPTTREVQHGLRIGAPRALSTQWGGELGPFIGTISWVRRKRVMDPISPLAVAIPVAASLAIVVWAIFQGLYAVMGDDVFLTLRSRLLAPKVVFFRPAVHLQIRHGIEAIVVRAAVVIRATNI